MLREIFDVSDFQQDEFNIQWTPPLNSKLSEKEYTARFKVDGDSYFVGFDKKKKDAGVLDYYLVWDLDRSMQGWWWTLKSLFNGQHKTLSKTTKAQEKGMAYVFKVFRGVMTCIHDFMRAKMPDIIEYEAADAELSRFYRIISKKLAPKFGYAAYHNMLVRKDSLRRPAIRSLITSPL